ncbi:MAG TPA: hypothetical protein PKX87_04620, partial [Alphaproteobacteria bacterium]|nr:hypothetical protein [Alphaproteobacteria bacterium]
VWARAHEMVCAQGKEADILGQINFYLVANRMWGEAVEQFTKDTAPIPPGRPVLRVIQGYKKT